MTAGQVLVVAGLVLQLAGAAITIRGLRLAWSHKRGDDQFLDPVIHRVRRGRDAFVKGTRRLFRRPAPGVIEIGPASEKSTAGQVYFQTGHPPLPETDDLAELVAALNERFEQLSIATNDLRRQVADERHRAETTEERLRAELAGEATERAEQERTLTVRAIRWEATGFALIILGAVIQAFGSLV